MHNWLMGQAMVRNALSQSGLSEREQEQVRAEARTKGVSAALGLLDSLKQAAQERLKALREGRERNLTAYYSKLSDDQPLPTSMKSSAPPPPLITRALTIIPVLIGLAVLDITLVSLTAANSVAISVAPDPISKGILAVGEIILGGIDIFVAYLHLSYAHWVVTGRGIHTWNDLSDWEIRP